MDVRTFEVMATTPASSTVPVADRPPGQIWEDDEHE